MKGARRAVWLVLVISFLGFAAAVPVVLATRSNATPAKGTGSSVIMASLAFSPQTLVVAKGTSVLFDNRDVAPHTVTADSPGGVDSGILGPGKTFQLVINEPLAYHCDVHPSMTARVELSRMIRFLNSITGGQLLLWKAIVATVVFFLAGIQVALAARFFRATTLPGISVGAAATMHRWVGRVALFLAVAVAFACLAGPAGPTSPTRVLLHTIFGASVFVILALKFTLLRVVQKGDRFLPLVGSLLFLTFGAIWLTSVADYVARR